VRKLIQHTQYAATMIVLTILGLVAGFSAYVAAAYLVGERYAWPGWFVMSPVFSLLAIFVHECGHAYAGRRAGYRIRKIVVSYLAFAPETQKWSLAKRPVTAGDLGGWVEADAPLRGETRAGETFYILGGPGANFIAAIVFIALAELPMPDSLTALSRGFGIFSLAVGLSNLLPTRMYGAQSDGLLLWKIWRPVQRPQRQKTPRSQWNVPRKW
jgi:hypothetical protein